MQVIYIFGNHFLSWVWIRDFYLKIRFHLARIHLQSFWLHINACQWSDHFPLKMGVLGWRRDRAEQDGVISRCKKWLELAILPPWSFGFNHAPCAGGTMANRSTTSWSRSFGSLWACWDGTCQVVAAEGGGRSEPRREINSGRGEWEGKKKEIDWGWRSTTGKDLLFTGDKEEGGNGLSRGKEGKRRESLPAHMLSSN